MKKDNAFSLILKIIIVGVLLSVVLFMIIMYSKNLNKQEPIDRINNQIISGEQQVDHQQLRDDYKQNMINILNSFNGNYEKLQKDITDLVVPSGFQKLHLELVIALDSILYGDNRYFAKQKLEDIANGNEWIKNSLDKVIKYLD